MRKGKVVKFIMDLQEQETRQSNKQFLTLPANFIEKL